MAYMKWRKRKKTESPTPWRLEERTFGETPVTSILAADGTEVVFDIYATEISREQALANATQIVESVNKVHPPKKKRKKDGQPDNVPMYGIKAYGEWKYFKSRAKFKNYLMDWIRSTEGAEQARAVQALSNLELGYGMTDTDAPCY